MYTLGLSYNHDLDCDHEPGKRNRTRGKERGVSRTFKRRGAQSCLATVTVFMTILKSGGKSELPTSKGLRNSCNCYAMRRSAQATEKNVSTRIGTHDPGRRKGVFLRSSMMIHRIGFTLPTTLRLRRLSVGERQIDLALIMPRGQFLDVLFLEVETVPEHTPWIPTSHGRGMIRR